jgi:sec-independent protein translocase protein TatA
LQFDTPANATLQCLLKLTVAADRTEHTLNIFFEETVMTNTALLFVNLGPTELIILLVIVLILFGANRVPQLMKGMGEGIRNFKSGMNEEPKETKETK